MRYSDDQTVGQISGATYINLSRLKTLQDGRETSANGTGQEKTSVFRMLMKVGYPIRLMVLLPSVVSYLFSVALVFQMGVAAMI